MKIYLKTMKNNLISIIIPTHNEENFIENCLKSIISNNYTKNELEIIVIDGNSEDKTQEIVKKYIAKYSFIKLINNPKKITPISLNMGIKKSKGDIIIRFDAHAKYEKYYIKKCVSNLLKHKVDNVGGTMITIPRTKSLIDKAIANVLSNRFGVGNSIFRTGSNKPLLVDTVFGGCYKKKLFKHIGLFNEKLSRGQDMEFNLRLKKSGGKTLFVPGIVSYYYAPSGLINFIKHTFRNGLWAILPFKWSAIMPVSIRHLIPLVFTFSLIITLFFIFPLFVLIIILYGLIDLNFSFKIYKKEKNLISLAITSIMFFIFHISYGLGSLYGLIKLIK